MVKHRRVKALVFAAALAVSGLAATAGPAQAFTPGGSCGNGTGSVNWADKKAWAWFSSVWDTCYLRVAVTCRRDNGGTNQYFGNIVTYGHTSSYDCDWNGTYNNALVGWGWQVSHSS